ncbi:MAG TPA: 2-phospho-L-lactate guanylyltransferase [Solirubrobacterales bacterium]|nr:2-phospho-L-lactate guanylyltransferase [Solirubrobacterales bacterium]
MQATAIVPVKRFAAAKQRLSDVLEPSDRARLSEAMLADVLAALGRCARIDRVLVVSGEPAITESVGSAGAELVSDPADSGHPEAALLGIEVARKSGAEAVALLPGDCPLLSPLEVDAAIGALSPPVVAVIPDRHGTGTNGLLLAPPDSIEPAFGPGSRERHLELAERADVPAGALELPSLALDLDTGGDLGALRELAGTGRLEGLHTLDALGAIRAAPDR